MQKKKRIGINLLFWLLRGLWLSGRGEQCSPAKILKDTFLLSYFCVTKSTKSHQRERSPLFENSSRVHELVAQAMRGKYVRQGINQKSAVLPLPSISYYHACEQSARDSRADSCTHCLHARIKGLAGVNLICALTGRSTYFLFLMFAVLGLYLVGVGVAETGGIDRFAKQTRSASSRQGRDCCRRRDLKILFLYSTFA